jgi:hypothetical protein
LALTGDFKAKNDIAKPVYLDSNILTPWIVRIAGSVLTNEPR